MELTDTLSLIEIFKQNAAAKHREAELAIFNERLLEEKKERKDTKKREEKEQENLEALVEATAEQTEAFRNQLSDYDTATVDALMENGRALDDVRETRAKMEASAFRLPDGEMAFKSQDGARVYSQSGTELSHQTVDPHVILDGAPRWEAMKAILDAQGKLTKERQDLHAFQQKVDDARESVDKGDVTADVLAKMDADLKRDMPMAVKERLPGVAVALDTPAENKSALVGLAKPTPQRSLGLAGP